MKQLFAWVGINDVQQCFATMANRLDMCAFEYLLDLVPEQRDVAGAFTIGDGCRAGR